MTISDKFVFNTLTLKQILWKTKTFFKNLEYCFLVETTKIDNRSFPFKTTLSEAIVKTNRMATTKWTYDKEWSFASDYFIFLENLFQVSNLLKRVNLMNQWPKCQYSYFSWALEFNFRVFFFFPVSILKLTIHFLDQIDQKRCFWFKAESVNSAIEFYIFKLV